MPATTIALTESDINPIAHQMADAINATTLFPFSASVVYGLGRYAPDDSMMIHVHIREDDPTRRLNAAPTWDWFEPAPDSGGIGIRADSKPIHRDFPWVCDPFTPPPGSSPLDRPVTGKWPITLSVQPNGCVVINGTQSESRLAVILNAILPVLRSAADIHGELPAPKLAYQPVPSFRLPRTSMDHARALVDRMRPHKWPRSQRLTADIVTASGLDTAIAAFHQALKTSGAGQTTRRLILSQVADFIKWQRE